MKRWIKHKAANFATRTTTTTRAPTTTVKTRILISPATRLSMNPFHTIIQPSTSTSTTHNNNNCGNTTNHCGTMMKHYHHNTVHHDHNHNTHTNTSQDNNTNHNNNNNNNNNNKTDEDLPFIRAEQLPSPLVTQQWFIHYCDTQSSSSTTTTNTTTNTTITTNEKQQHALIQSIMNDITKERLFNSDTMNICVVLLDQPMNPLQNMNSFAKQLYDCWSMGNHTIIMTVNQTNHIGLYVVDEQNSIASRPVPSVFNKELIKQLTSMKKSTISREMQEDKSATAATAAMTTGENNHSTTVNTTTTPTTTTTTNDVAAAAAIDYELVIQVLQVMLKKLKTQYSPISDQFLTAQQLKRKNLESIIQHHNGTNERFNRQYRHRKLHRMGNSIVEFQFQRVLGSMVLLVIVVYGAYSYWKSTSTCPNCDSFALKTKKTYDSNVISNDGQAMKEWEQLSSASLLTPNNKKEFELGSCSFTHKKCNTCQYETMQRTVNPSSSVGHCYKCDTLALTTEIKNQPQGRMVVRKCQFCGDEDVKPSAYQSS